MTGVDWQTSLGAARARQAANDPDGAIALMRDALREAPAEPRLMEFLAQLLQGRPDDQPEALQLWQQLLLQEPSNSRARVESTNLLLRAGRLSEAEALLLAGRVLEPGSFRWAEWHAGTIQRQPERAEDARAAWATVVERFPTEERGYQGLALALRSLQLPQRAREVVEEGLRRCAGAPRLLLLRAQLTDVLEPENEARIARWRSAVEALPTEVATQIGLCTALAEFEQVAAAEASYREAAATFPTNERLPLGHAQLLTRLFRLDEALALCEEFLDKSERGDATVRHVAHLLSRLQRIDALERLLLRPAAANLPEATALRQRVATLRTQFEASAARWHKAAAEMPGATVQAIAFRFGDARDHGASQYGSLRHLAEAPNDQARLRLCQICFSASGAEFGEAAGYFSRRITELYPEDLKAHLDLAFSLMTPVTMRSSEAALRDVLNRFPGNAEAALLLIGILENAGRDGDYDALLRRIAVAEREVFPRAFVQQCEIRLYACARLRGETSAPAREAIPSWSSIVAGFPAAPAALTLVEAAASTLTSPAIRRPAPQVAICAAGQLRGFETAWPALREKLAGPLDADIFVSTWDKVGTSHGATNSIARLVSPAFFAALPPVQRRATEFLRSFPRTAALFSRDESVSAEALQEQLGLADVEVESGDAFTARLEELGIDDRGRNPCRMVYRNWRCDALMRAYAERHNKRYDLVVRTRPDLLLKRIDLDAVRAMAEHPDRVLVPRFRSVVLDDQFAVGNDAAMRVYAGIWPLVERQRGNHYLPNMGDVWSERLLRQHLFTLGISIGELRTLGKDLCQRVPHWAAFADALLDDVAASPGQHHETLQALLVDLDARRAAAPAAEQAMIDLRRGLIEQLSQQPGKDVA